MKNTLSVLISDIADIQTKKIEKADGHHQISVNTLRMKHTLCKAFQNGFCNLRKAKAARFHGGTDGFLFSKEHHAKKPVLKSNASG